MRRRARAVRVLSAVLVLCAAVSSCRSTRENSPYLETKAPAERRTTDAERLTRSALVHVDSDDLVEAERLLREALAADLFYGPAHNNLGVVFLKNGNLYDAANEFTWARKLLPDNPDPRVNLALVLEQAGSIGQAIEQYERALAASPSSLAAIKGMTRLFLREGREDDRLKGWLDQIATRSREKEWCDWAKKMRATRLS